MKNKNFSAIIISVLTLILGVTCYFILPGDIAVQWSSGGVTNTLPTVAAVLIGYGITALLIYISYAKNNKIYMGLSLIGVISFIIFMVMNLL